MSYKPTVTIGIPAYNEEANIKQLLVSLLTQKQETFELKEIIVVSDGSSDRTVELANEVGSDKIRVIDNLDQKGKVVRLNELFKIIETDYLIQFDADVIFAHDSVVSLLVEFAYQYEADLICGNHKPLLPKTFAEKLAYYGVGIWNTALGLLGDADGLYRCTGQIRGFSRKFLNHFSLPHDIGSGEDVYSFLFAKENGFKTGFVKEATVYFRLASTFKDYIKQTSRFIQSPRKMDDYFKKSTLDNHRTMTSGVRSKALVKNLGTSPFYIVFAYLVLQFITQIVSFIRNKNSIWSIAKSSKTLK